MVNTFITRYPLSDAIKDLDYRRLGKQRVEAQQVLTAILSAHAIAKEYCLPECPSTLEHPGPRGDILREIWYTTVYDYYKTVVNARNEYLYRDNDGTKFSTTLSKTCYKRVGFGFAHHPVTFMWVGYEDGLRYYIALCIEEWIKRGYKNTMTIYLFSQEPELPWWVKCPTFQHSQRSALLRKEKIRKEAPWYWKMSHIVDGTANTVWYHTGYLWTNHLSLENRLLLQEGNLLPKLCADIMNDFPEENSSSKGVDK